MFNNYRPTPSMVVTENNKKMFDEIKNQFISQLLISIEQIEQTSTENFLKDLYQTKDLVNFRESKNNEKFETIINYLYDQIEHIIHHDPLTDVVKDNIEYEILKLEEETDVWDTDTEDDTEEEYDEEEEN